MNKKSKVLLLDNHDSFTHNIAQILRESGSHFDIVKNDEVILNEIKKYDKIIFSPGPGVPGDVQIMYDILHKFGDSKSILGICLGHQAIGDYYGWKVVNLGNSYHGIRQKVKVTVKDKILFSGVPDEFEAGLYHSWALEETVSGILEVTALSSDGVIMAIRHRALNIRGVQFHPESHMTYNGRTIILNWLKS